MNERTASIDWPSLGAFVKSTRRKRDISSRELAESADVSRATLVRLESGLECRLVTLKKIELALGFSEGLFSHLGKVTQDPFFLQPHSSEYIAIRKNPKCAKNLPKYSQRQLQDPHERRRLGKLGFVSAFLWEQNAGMASASMRSILMELYDETAESQHIGEEFAFAVHGTSVVKLGEQALTLRERDKATFRSSLPHRYAPGSSGAPSVLLITWIDSPPKGD